jgi:KAP family P-loop domain
MRAWWRGHAPRSSRRKHDAADVAFRGQEEDLGPAAPLTAETRGPWPLGDDPVGGEAGQPDSLGRDVFVRRVSSVLNRVRQQTESSVIAIVADWGAGKTSMVNLVQEALEADRSGWLIAEYNPWSYSDLESLIMGFFAELRAAIPKDERWDQARERLGGLATDTAEQDRGEEA